MCGRRHVSTEENHEGSRCSIFGNPPILLCLSKPPGTVGALVRKRSKSGRVLSPWLDPIASHRRLPQDAYACRRLPARRTCYGWPVVPHSLFGAAKNSQSLDDFESGFVRLLNRIETDDEMLAYHVSSFILPWNSQVVNRGLIDAGRQVRPPDIRKKGRKKEVVSNKRPCQIAAHPEISYLNKITISAKLLTRLRLRSYPVLLLPSR